MLYVCYSDLNIEGYIGVKKKIKAQCRVFERKFGAAYYTVFAGGMLYLLQEDSIVDKEFALTKNLCNEILLKWLMDFNLQKVYIRCEYVDIWIVNFLKELKTKNIKAVLEFPTFPYDSVRGICISPSGDKYYREQLCEWVDCCTTYANFESVFGIPCIPLINGVDIEEHRVKQRRKKDGNIILLAVATLVRWHGYERVIQGIHDYYLNGGKRNIIFNVVGNGGQLSYYKKITDEYQLQEHIVFHGRLEGSELDSIYDKSDIAIGSLGFYKINLRSGSPIKLGEYCARGIPFIYGYEDISFSKPPYFSYQVSNDSTPVNIVKVLEFYDSLYDGRDFIKDMRQYALSKLTWDKIFEPVIEYLS